MADWLALVIGNTRWHWAWFRGDRLRQVWHTAHLSSPTSSEPGGVPQIPALVPGELPLKVTEFTHLWAVSVVPAQAQHLQGWPAVRWIKQLPLGGVYPTMGLDRVVTLWGASQRYGWPVLVIDAGTALTFTAGAGGKCLGGSILLGLRSHLSALRDYTAALPSVDPPPILPAHWAQDTPSAIQSGVLHTLLAGIHHFVQHWLNHYPQATVLFTGGDGQYLYQLYQQAYIQQNRVLLSKTRFDANLMFWGIAAYRNEETRAL